MLSAAVDWSLMTESIGSEVAAAVPVALAAVGIVVGIFVAYGLIVSMILGSGVSGRSSHSGIDEVNDVEGQAEDI